MKVLVMSDSFKGTLSSNQVNDTIADVIVQTFPNAEIKTIVTADGGEGTIDAILQVKQGQKLFYDVHNANNEVCQAQLALIDNGATAVIEVAECIGLPQTSNKNPMITTTVGVGELIIRALDLGVKRIIINCGGSSTNDGGCGMLHSLGVRFHNYRGNAFLPTGGNLSEIESIDVSHLDKRVFSTDVVAICDVNNPMCGLTGSAYTFALQKGASKEQLPILDNGLKHLFKTASQTIGSKVEDFPGAGAAGGLVWACVSFLNSSKISGINFLLDIVNFDALCENVDYVITGEGKLDTQSFGGKVIDGIIQRSKNKKAKVLAVVGCSELSQDEARARGLYAFAPCVENKIGTAYWHQPTEYYEQLLRSATRKIVEVIQKEERE